ncbi:hypothetical protein TWF173_002812 [Orbilia oligospora]|nr:hypothetical protein TWF173_002812 [Orbilia oligospora]
MAAPIEKTATDMSGCYVMNRELSGDTDAILSYQSIGWLTRKTLGRVPVTITLTQTKEAVQVDSVAAGFITTNETVQLDDKSYPLNHKVWGEITSKAKLIKVSDIDDETLKEGWVGEDVIEVTSQSEVNKWKATQIWGFQDVEVKGEKQRRYFRRIRLEHKKGIEYCHTCYDYSPVA